MPPKFKSKIWNECYKLAFDSFPMKEFQFLTSEHFSKNNNVTKDNTNKSTEMSSGQTYSKPQ